MTKVFPDHPDQRRMLVRILQLGEYMATVALLPTTVELWLVVSARTHRFKCLVAVDPAATVEQLGLGKEPAAISVPQGGESS